MLKLFYGQAVPCSSEEVSRSVFTSETKLLHDNKTAGIETHMLKEQARDLLDKCLGDLPDDGWEAVHYADRFDSIGVLHAKIYKLNSFMGTLSKSNIFPSKVFCEHVFFIEGYVINTWITN